jgi:hypothetical protein
MIASAVVNLTIPLQPLQADDEEQESRGVYLLAPGSRTRAQKETTVEELSWPTKLTAKTSNFQRISGRNSVSSRHKFYERRYHFAFAKALMRLVASSIKLFGCRSQTCNEHSSNIVALCGSGLLIAVAK